MLLHSLKAPGHALPDSLDAFHKRLVKRIEVKGFEVKNLRGTDGYLCLEGIVLSPNKPVISPVRSFVPLEKLTVPVLGSTWLT